MEKIWAVIGDYYHPAEWIRQPLQRAIDAAGEIEVLECSEKELQHLLSQRPKAVILFKENRINPADSAINHWMDEDLQRTISNYVQSGGGWLAWHSGLASYPVEGMYVNMLKGYFQYHPDPHRLVHYQINPKPDLRMDSVSFDIVDEHYFVHCEETETNVFLRSRSADGDSVAGWYHQFGNGKVCCLTPAHRKEGLLHPQLIDVLGKCIQWVSSL